MSSETIVPGEQIKRLTNLQKVISVTMTRSKQNIPHFYMSIEIDFSELIKLKSQLKADVNKNVTYTPLLIMATAKILKEYPMLNAHVLEEHCVKVHDFVNMGVAVATERGLIVPVIKDVNNKNLDTIITELRELTQRARIGRSSMEDLKGGTFTISNAGMFGVSQVISIIKPPESAILSIGAIIKRPVVEEDQMKICPVSNLTLSADHRVIDGETVGRFLSSLKALLESEEELSKIFNRR